MPQSPRAAQAGATLVEFALTVPLFLMLFLFIVDASFVLYKHLRLSHVTTELTRVLSTKIGERMEIHGGTVQCSEITSWSSQIISDYRVQNPLLSEGYSLQLETLRPNVPPYPLIGVRGAWSGTCITCKFFSSSSGVSLEAQSVLVIENDNPVVCDPGCTGVTCVP